jgi:hypothetical protein
LTLADVSNLMRGYESRAATFENPSGARGAGGTAGNGRKGAPWKLIVPGETVTLAAFDGSGQIGHIWLTIAQGGGTPSPVFLRSQLLEMTYGNASEPSVSVPVGDYFGAVHGLLAPYASALTALNEGRGYTSRVPVPFRDGIAVTYTNNADRPAILYYQVDVLLGPQPEGSGYLHVVFNRDNPTTLKQDFCVWDEALHGPGRFLGWTGGVRVLDDRWWWGEGEMKFYFDGEELPTICGTGSEDYFDSAWCFGTYAAPEAGAPLVTSTIGPDEGARHEWVSFYRWHISDPVVFDRTLRATMQQIGAAVFAEADRDAYETFKGQVEPAGLGWNEGIRGLAGMGLYERSDDWCGSAFVYLEEPQPVPRVDLAVATADLGYPKGQHVHREMPRRPEPPT